MSYIDGSYRLGTIPVPVTYESWVRDTKGATPIPIYGGVFWSKGWQGCVFGCGHQMDSHVRLKPKVRHEAGVVTVGWYCR